jgi:hypothetical protein
VQWDTSLLQYLCHLTYTRHTSYNNGKRGVYPPPAGQTHSAKLHASRRLQIAYINFQWEFQVSLSCHYLAFQCGLWDHLRPSTLWGPIYILTGHRSTGTNRVPHHKARQTEHCGSAKSRVYSHKAILSHLSVFSSFNFVASCQMNRFRHGNRWKVCKRNGW